MLCRTKALFADRGYDFGVVASMTSTSLESTWFALLGNVGKPARQVIVQRIHTLGSVSGRDRTAPGPAGPDQL